jgi:hypothetical protein
MDLCGDGLPNVAFLECTCLFHVLIGAKRKDKQEVLIDDEVNRPHPSHEIPPSMKALELEHGHFQ